MDDSPWSGSERLFALESASGAVAWDWKLPKKTLSPPAYADGTLYVGEWYPDADTGRLHAVDATDGSVTWTSETEPGGIGSPTVAGDTVYVNQGEEFAAVAASDGSQRWRLETGARAGTPVVVGDTAYLRTNPGHNYDSRILAVREP
ncbi:PQQ-binding-like beta-propeller repeat protein [Salinigranum sp. GCM10025319]|uniref:outer membrane protein assembly factor BamB family protein n=1 Tax=Salinigranum sp. GCM10025319 TaxID=3252687 RepID=UPI003619F9C3